MDMLALAAVDVLLKIRPPQILEALQNTAIVVDAGAANNQFAPECPIRRDV